MHTDILFQISVAIVTATVLAILARWTRQPVILGYIAAGVILGPLEGIGLLSSHDVESISELGLILLLFMIGLEMDLKHLKKGSGGSVGMAIAVAGAAQFALCVGMGLALFPRLALGPNAGEYAALYLAVAAALSSTMIVVKILYDKDELDGIPGRITLGILVFQDIWAILFLALQPNLHDPAPIVLVLSLAKGAAIVAFAFLASRYALPVIFRSIAKVPELLVILALAWCFLVVLIAAELGLSREMGALIAGVSLSTFPYSLDVVAKVISLRDFFITLFFVTLGTKIPRPDVELVLVALAVAGFLVVSRLLSITPILHKMRLGNRASLIPAMNLAQISEFSLVICSLGVGYGHIGERVLSVVVYVLVITSVISTYVVFYNHEIYLALNPWLVKLGLRDLQTIEPDAPQLPPKAVAFIGFSRHASSLLHELLDRWPRIAEFVGVVDFNPIVKEELDRRGIRCVYGDVSHQGTLSHANIEDARVLISTVPDSILRGTTNARLLKKLRGLAPQARIIVTAERLDDARELYDGGASFVFIPRLMGAHQLADVVLAALDGDLSDERQLASAMLLRRAEVLP